MGVSVWDTRQTPDPSFATAWSARLACAPHAHYAMRTDFLEWDARHGRHALALIVDDPPSLVVLRRVRGGWSSGWMWRPQMVVEAPQAGPVGISAAQRRGLLAAVDAVTHGELTRCYLPGERIADEPAFEAGATFLHAVDRSEDELFATFDTTRRRMVRKALKERYEVIEAHTFDHFRSFAKLQAETEQRRGNTPGTVPDEVADSGESWREWELPWMLLLVAVRDGEVVAGSGFGFSERGTVDYRTNASRLDVRKDGVNVALAWEGLRWSRAAGARWLNWGGVTEFKTRLGGERVSMWCRLGGGAVWRLPNRMTASWHQVRPRLAGLWHSLARRGAAS